MPKLADRVLETTTTAGTGTLTLAGAVTGYRSFNTAFSNGDVVFYSIDNGQGEWEVGYGSVGTGSLTRSTVLDSSNGGSLVVFSAGLKQVWCDAPSISLLPDQTSNSGKVLSTDGSVPSWITPNAGTVTAVSVATANGLAGTSSGGATPALTLSTTVTGVLKGNGTTISAAVSGTDYAPATSGTSILKGNGSGGFSNATAGTDYAPATSGTAILKGDGSGGFSSATAGTDYSAGTSALATGVLKSTTSTGALTIAVAGTDYSAGTSALATGLLKSTTSTGALTIAVANTDYLPSTDPIVSGVFKINGSSSGYVGFQTAAAAGSTTYVLPAADGSSGQALVTNGSASLSWGSAGISQAKVFVMSSIFGG